MSLKIIWNLDVQVVGGPKISASQTLNIGAYDLVETDVEKTIGTGKGINVQPDEEGQVQFLLIKLKDNAYSTDISYHINTEENDPDKRTKLDSVHVLFGEGALGLYEEAPKKIYLYNNTDATVSVQILIGRKAVI